MAGHPQSSPRGLWAKNALDIGGNRLSDDGTNLIFNNGIKVSNAAGGVLTANATDLLLPGGIQISGARTLRANSTGFVAATVETELPTTDEGAAFTVISNSTGTWIAVNTTGTTWKYVDTTAVAADAL